MVFSDQAAMGLVTFIERQKRSFLFSLEGKINSFLFIAFTHLRAKLGLGPVRNSLVQLMPPRGKDLLPKKLHIFVKTSYKRIID